nr:hypothetical protein [Ktedonobacter sp. SOSP1-85]
MPSRGDPASVQAPAELRHGSLDKVKLVEDELHVLYAGPPEQGSSGSVSEA